MLVCDVVVAACILLSRNFFLVVLCCIRFFVRVVVVAIFSSLLTLFTLRSNTHLFHYSGYSFQRASRSYLYKGINDTLQATSMMIVCRECTHLDRYQVRRSALIRALPYQRTSVCICLDCLLASMAYNTILGAQTAPGKRFLLFNAILFELFNFFV